MMYLEAGNEVFDEHVHIVMKGHTQEKEWSHRSFFLFVLSASSTTLPFSLSHFIVNIFPLLQKLGSLSLFTKIKVICILKIFIYVEYIKIYTDFYCM